MGRTESPYPLHPLQICSTHTKFAPPTPNLLHPLQICSARSFSDVWLIFLHYINTKQKHIKVGFCQTQINILIRYSPHPLRSLILHNHSAAHSPHHSTHSYTVLDKGGKMHMKQSPYQLHPVPVFKFKFIYYAPHVYIMVCFNFFAYEKKTYSEKYEWASLLLLSELSISALSSHSCLHVQELHTTQTDSQTHTHTHNMYIIIRMFILMFTYENEKYTRSSKLTIKWNG